jgi:hypothetical protein
MCVCTYRNALSVFTKPSIVAENTLGAVGAEVKLATGLRELDHIEGAGTTVVDDLVQNPRVGGRRRHFGGCLVCWVSVVDGEALAIQCERGRGLKGRRPTGDCLM